MSPQEKPIERASSVTETMALHWEIEQFLFSEAELLDERRFDEWYELLADDLTYLLPVQSNVYPGDIKSRAPESAGYGGDFFSEHKAGMHLRVKKALSGRDHIERPPSKLRHLVTNVRVTPSPDTADEFDVRSSFLIHRVRHGEYQDLYVGRRDDVIRRRDNAYGWQIAKRTITLDQTVLLGGGIGFFF